MPESTSFESTSFKSTGSVRIRVDLPHNRGYDIVPARLDRLPDELKRTGLNGPACLLVTDEHVEDLYGQQLRSILRDGGWDPTWVVLPAGERTKSRRYLQQIQDAALTSGVDRRTPVIAFGGGVPGDIAGFAAATLLRGLPLVQVPTTVIAQVDSAIGGKTGINHPTGKNLIGAFHQPRFVLADTSLLDTLPEREYISGLAEAVKHALISEYQLFEWIYSSWQQILHRNASVVAEMVHRAAAIKASVVSRDEMETGLREILNFGHTFGHSLEHALGYGTLTHGEAVFIGMRAATRLSARLNENADFERVENFLSDIDLPAVPEDITPARLIEAMQSDKKRRGAHLRFVVLTEPGAASVVSEVPEELVTDAWNTALRKV